MEYILDSKRFHFHYKEVKQKYDEYISLSDKEFINRLPEIIHTACFISYIKELDSESTLSDIGVVHELAHLQHLPDDTDIKAVRELFKIKCELV